MECKTIFGTLFVKKKSSEIRLLAKKNKKYFLTEF
jgi:hypothetical protein